VTIALLAGLAMLVQDLIAVPLVQAESQYRAHMAACLDVAGWLVAIATTSIAVNALTGHDTDKKIAVVLVVSTANYVGTYSGVKLGKRFRQTDPVIVDLLTWREHAIRTYPDLALA
jgi:hypothetical protein